MGNNGVSKIIGVGDINLETASGKIFLKDVRHVSDLRMNVISVGRLDESGYSSTFSGGAWKLSKGALILAHGTECCSLYRLKAKVSPPKTKVVEEVSTVLWRRILGEKKSQLPAREAGPGVVHSLSEVCTQRLVGRQRRVTFADERQSTGGEQLTEAQDTAEAPTGEAPTAQDEQTHAQGEPAPPEKEPAAAVPIARRAGRDRVLSVRYSNHDCILLTDSDKSVSFQEIREDGQIVVQGEQDSSKMVPESAVRRAVGRDSHCRGEASSASGGAFTTRGKAGGRNKLKSRNAGDCDQGSTPLKTIDRDVQAMKTTAGVDSPPESRGGIDWDYVRAQAKPVGPLGF